MTNPHSRIDEKLKRLREAGIECVGEKLPVDYSQKRQTREEALAEVERLIQNCLRKNRPRYEAQRITLLSANTHGLSRYQILYDSAVKGYVEACKRHNRRDIHHGKRRLEWLERKLKEVEQ